LIPQALQYPQLAVARIVCDGKEYFRSVQGFKDSLHERIANNEAWITEVFFKEGVTTQHSTKPKGRSALITAKEPPIHTRFTPRNAFFKSGSRWSEFINENNSTITSSPVNGNGNYIIEVQHEKGSNTEFENHKRTVLTLDQSKAFLPVKVEMGDVTTLLQTPKVAIPSWRLDRFPNVAYEIRWSEADESGHYKLLGATRTVYARDKDGWFVRGIDTIAVSSCLYNPGIPDSFFEKEFASGTKVTDATKRTGSKPYIVP